MIRLVRRALHAPAVAPASRPWSSWRVFRWGLGVGATTTMYGVVNRVANYQLGFADADRLAVLWNSDTQQGHSRAAAELGNRSRHPRERPVVRVVRLFPGWRRTGHAVDRPPKRPVSSQMPVDVNAPVGRRREAPARPHLSSRGFQRLVSSRKKRGRSSSATTRGRSGSAEQPDVIGKSIHVDGEPRSIIGVMPKGLLAGAVGRQDRVLDRRTTCERFPRRAG